jgi:branched-chain amino acid transport system permease protein
MIVIGGAGSIRGVVTGAILLSILPELLRFLGVGSAQAANIRQIVYGLALVVVLLVRPEGLAGKPMELK